jgi:hypothetical protein
MAYGTRELNTGIIWAPSNNPQFSMLTPISLRSFLIFSSHLRLGLPKGLFPVGLTKLTHPMVYGTLEYNVGFTRAPSNNPEFLMLIPISLSHLRLGLPKGLFPVCLTKLTHSMAYGTRRSYTAFTRALSNSPQCPMLMILSNLIFASSPRSS